ncbi:hypothetical protein [Oscillibacter sp.]|uniref:hypothetical protein n=1 Tax=Oscillibacter sp. TaxID=1945593 RepID=UPI0028A24746|nr:hypothetical protein [Oscillibacter sp.]
MKKIFSRGMSLLLILTFLFSLCVPAMAKDMSVQSSQYLSKYDGVITTEGGGVIKISFLVIGTSILDKIGASQIVVEEQSGSYWIPVKTYNNTKNPELSTTNDYSYANYVLYNGEAGAVYRAEITVFGNTDSRTFITASQKA